MKMKHYDKRLFSGDVFDYIKSDSFTKWSGQKPSDIQELVDKMNALSKADPNQKFECQYELRFQPKVGRQDAMYAKVRCKK